MQRRIIISTLAVAVVSMVAFEFRRPAKPTEWTQLRTGMTRANVLSIVGTSTFDARDIKGFEVVTHYTRQGFQKAYWQVFLDYDDTEHLKSAEYAFQGISDETRTPLF